MRTYRKPNNGGASVVRRAGIRICEFDATYLLDLCRKQSSFQTYCLIVDRYGYLDVTTLGKLGINVKDYHITTPPPAFRDAFRIRGGGG